MPDKGDYENQVTDSSAPENKKAALFWAAFGDAQLLDFVAERVRFELTVG